MGASGKSDRFVYIVASNTSLSGPGTQRRSASLILFRWRSRLTLLSTRSSNATTKAGRSSISSRWRSFPLRASSWSSLRANDRSRGVSEDRARSSRHAVFDRVQAKYGVGRRVGLSQSTGVDAVWKKRKWCVLRRTPPVPTRNGAVIEVRPSRFICHRRRLIR